MASKESALLGQIEREITQYLTGFVTLSPDNIFSQAQLVRRISLFEGQVYPTGKFDTQKNYKFWFEIIQPRIYGEVKNIDFDTSSIRVYSERMNDALCDA